MVKRAPDPDTILLATCSGGDCPEIHRVVDTEHCIVQGYDTTDGSERRVLIPRSLLHQAVRNDT